MVLRSLKSIKETDTDIEFLPLWKEGDEEEEKNLKDSRYVRRGL